MLKKTIIFLWILILSQDIFSQKIIVSTAYATIAYVGLPTSLDVVAENYKCSEIFVSTDNGRIEGKNCDYILYAAKIGQAKITVKTKYNGKLKKIGETIFRIKEIPEPIFKIGSGKRSMPVVELKNQQYARLEDSDAACWDLCNYKIDSFKISIISDKILTNEILNIGSKLDPTIFKDLQSGDMVLIQNILVTASNGMQKRLDDIIIRVY